MTHILKKTKLLAGFVIHNWQNLDTSFLSQNDQSNWLRLWLYLSTLNFHFLLCFYPFSITNLQFQYLLFIILRDAFQKKNCWEGDIVPYRGEGGKKSPFLVHQKGDIFLWGRGQNLFVTCPMFTFMFLFPHNLWQFLMPYIMKIFYITSHNKAVDLNLPWSW